MGYETERFWNLRGSGFDELEWVLITTETEKILKEFSGALKGPFGEPKPIISDSEISFIGSPGKDPFIFSRFGNFSSCDTGGNPYDDVVVSILAIAKKVSGDKVEIPWFMDNSPLFRKLGAWNKLPKGWTDESVQKFWKTMTGKNKHKVTKCMKKMEGKMDNPGAFCASLADRVTGSTEWRKGPRKKSKKK